MYFMALLKLKVRLGRHMTYRLIFLCYTFSYGVVVELEVSVSPALGAAHLAVAAVVAEAKLVYSCRRH
jgi:hypothetical protein